MIKMYEKSKNRKKDPKAKAFFLKTGGVLG